MSSPVSLWFHWSVILENGNWLSLLILLSHGFHLQKRWYWCYRQMGILSTLWLKLWGDLYYLILDIFKKRRIKGNNLENLLKDNNNTTYILTPLYCSIHFSIITPISFFYKSSVSPKVMDASGRKGPRL